MFRIFFVMVTTMLVGLGSGYFLWGSRVARLTESLSGLTLELDTMRARLAAPAQPQESEGGVKAADQLRVINESIAAMRQELADQKPLLEKAGTAAPAAENPTEAAAANAQLLVVRQQLAGCMDDKAALEAKLQGAAPAGGQAGYAPAYQQPAAPAYPPRRQPIPADEMPDYESPPGR